MFLLGAADGWLEMGDTEKALQFFDDAATVAEREKCPLAPALQLVTWARVCRVRGHWAKAHATLDSAENQLREDKDELGILQVKLDRAIICAREKDADRAKDILRECSNEPLLAVRPDLRMLHVEARCYLVPQVNLEELRTDYEALRRAYPECTRNLPVLALLARAHAEKQDWKLARVYFHDALSLARTLVEQLTTDLDRQRLVVTLLPLRVEARDCFQRLGIDDDPLSETYFAPAGRPSDPLHAPGGLTKFLHFIAILVHTVNLALTILTVVFGAAIQFQSWSEVWELTRNKGPLMTLAMILFEFKEWGRVVLAMWLSMIIAGALRSLFAKKIDTDGKARLWAVVLFALGVMPWLFLAYLALDALDLSD
jgi:tetratricopeptide (TPR) repeat protein